MGAESLRHWVHRAEIDSGRRPGTSMADAQRIAQLERENKELGSANDIRKAASAGSSGQRPASPASILDVPLEGRANVA